MPTSTCSCSNVTMTPCCTHPSEETEPGPASRVPELVELESAEEGADDEVALDLLLLVAPLDHAVLEEAEVGDDPAGEVGVEHGALAEDLEVHREVEAAAEQDGVLCGERMDIALERLGRKSSWMFKVQIYEINFAQSQSSRVHLGRKQKRINFPLKWMNSSEFKSLSLHPKWSF